MRCCTLVAVRPLPGTRKNYALLRQPQLLVLPLHFAFVRTREVSALGDDADHGKLVVIGAPCFGKRPVRQFRLICRQAASRIRRLDRYRAPRERSVPPWLRIIITWVL